MLRISVTKIFLWDHFFYMECVFETFGKLKNVFSIDTVILPEFLFAWLNFLTHLRWQERAQKHTNSQGWGSDSWLRTNIAYEACFSLCIFGCLLSSFYVTRLLQAHGGWNVNITTPCRTEVTLQDKLVMSTWHNAALCCCTKLALRTRSVALSKYGMRQRKLSNAGWCKAATGRHTESLCSCDSPSYCLTRTVYFIAFNHRR